MKSQSMVQTQLGLAEQNSHSDPLLYLVIALILVVMAVIGIIGCKRLCKKINKPMTSSDPTGW